MTFLVSGPVIVDYHLKLCLCLQLISPSESLTDGSKGSSFRRKHQDSSDSTHSFPSTPDKYWTNFTVEHFGIYMCLNKEVDVMSHETFLFTYSVFLMFSYGITWPTVLALKSTLTLLISDMFVLDNLLLKVHLDH